MIKLKQHKKNLFITLRVLLCRSIKGNGIPGSTGTGLCM